jgi:hypothetical protein
MGNKFWLIVSVPLTLALLVVMLLQSGCDEVGRVVREGSEPSRLAGPRWDPQ